MPQYAYQLAFRQLRDRRVALGRWDTAQVQLAGADTAHFACCRPHIESNRPKLTELVASIAGFPSVAEGAEVGVVDMLANIPAAVGVRSAPAGRRASSRGQRKAARSQAPFVCHASSWGALESEEAMREAQVIYPRKNPSGLRNGRTEDHRG